MVRGPMFRRLFQRSSEPAEVDVAARLDATYDHARAQLRDAQQALATITAHVTRIDDRSYQLRAAASAADVEARDAVRDGRDADARAALTAKREHEDHRLVVQRQLADLRAHQEQLAEQHAQLRAQVERFALTKETVKARHAAMTAQAAADTAYVAAFDELDGLDASAGDLQRRATDMQARALALVELQQAGVYEELGT